MPINLLSPVAKIPFGKYKDTLVWEAPTTWFRWLMEQDITEYTVKTIEDALRMKEEEGGYAVLRKSKKKKFLFVLKSIHTTQGFAEAHCDDTDEWQDYVYPLNKKQITDASK